jgi:hypothetical protein
MLQRSPAGHCKSLSGHHKNIKSVKYETSATQGSGHEKRTAGPVTLLSLLLSSFVEQELANTNTQPDLPSPATTSISG